MDFDPGFSFDVAGASDSVAHPWEFKGASQSPFCSLCTGTSRAGMSVRVVCPFSSPPSACCRAHSACSIVLSGWSEHCLRTADPYRAPSALFRVP